ncbi:hypothetical protein YYG_00132 [Plasmodium vinckei petteri]|uniref:Translation initiation factor IF-2, putative n=1 Tax=Plasmodium vinckei petteri TaxID=138298 RepID=W7AQQ4_PLAVN|nr:hypothetical protein YYG_00132 [Plasmodium vinckei petteri]CAD2113129.1 translation initiation factor IF-2, putative [Plasmodium vinckei petteri]
MFFLNRQLFYKGKYIPVGRRVFREKLVTGRKQKSPIILLPPYISIHELRLMLNINYEICFKVANVYKCGNKYRWKDSNDRVFQTVNKRNVIIPYNVAAFVSKVFKFKPRLIEPELYCEEENRSDISLEDIYQKTYKIEKDYNENQSKTEGKSNIFNNNNFINDNDTFSIPVDEINKYAESNESKKKRNNYYTVVSVIGHINHGKTTLLDKVTNNNLAHYEAGCITQNIKPIHFELEPYKFTFLDTPGHKVFQILRGRAAFLSDILIILISLEVGAEIQTEEAIKYADKFNIPVIFALNKADIYKENESVVKAELKNQCNKMFDEGTLKHNYSNEIDNAITISSLTGYNLPQLINRIYFIKQNINLPYHSANVFYNNQNGIKKNVQLKDVASANNNEIDSFYNINDEAKGKQKREYCLSLLKKYIRKSDCLLALDKTPFGMGVVVDITKDSSKGTILHVIVRNGFFIEGNYFICGSAYGKIQKMYKFNSNFKEYCTYATVGMAIQISGIKKKHGSATTDDLIFTLAQNDAFRLCQYRLMVEKLSTLQVSGEEIQVSWENDMKKNEFYAEDIYKDRLEMSEKRKAIEEFGIENENNIFNQVTMKDFHKSNTQIEKEENDFAEIHLEEENKYEQIKNDKNNYIKSILSQNDDDQSILIPEQKKFIFFDNQASNDNLLNSLADSKKDAYHKEDQTFRPDYAHSNQIRQNSNLNIENYSQTDICIEDDPSSMANQKMNGINNNIQHSKTESDAIDGETEFIKIGRKNKYYKSKNTINNISFNKENLESIANEEYNEGPNKLNEPWYYEESEDTWSKKVLQRNEELMNIWRNKTRQRELEKERQQFYEKQMILKNEITKRNVLGEKQLTEDEINNYLYNDHNKEVDSNSSKQEEGIKLPKKNIPVIPIIIRTNYVGMFDIFLDEFENIQNKYNVKISVVHGGIGPVTPNDVVHAEVETNYGYCCIYAFHVKVLPDSVKQAVLSNIVIKQFDVFTDVIDDIVKRIKNIKALMAHNMYVRSLKNERTQEGL